MYAARSRMPMAELLLGVDGGGSKTRALVADRAGNLLGAGSGPSSNYHFDGFESATAAIDRAVATALLAAGRPADQPVAVAVFGIAGVDRPSDRELWERWLAQRGFAGRRAVVNDAELLLAAGTPDGWGCALICGTGSICWGHAPDGRTARSGGWGATLGDEGSGYDVAVRALRLATQTADGRAAAPGLLAGVLDEWQLSTPEDLIGFVYDPKTTRAAIAGLARRVAALAEAGDADAAQLLDDAGRDLACMVRVVAVKLGLERTPLALGGGFIGSSAGLRHATLRELDDLVESTHYVADPATGAVVLARRLLE